jgi:PAS domain S-box-containing protein
MAQLPPYSALARAVAQGVPPLDVLLDLHRELLAATGGTRSVILQRDGRSGRYAATSGYGCEQLGGPWLPAQEAVTLENQGVNRAGCWLQPLGDLRSLRERLGADAALVAPLPAPGTPGFLLVSDPQLAPPEVLHIADRATVEFALALELVRLSRDATLHHHIQELLLGFSRGISATVSVAAALASLCVETNALFGTIRVSVWLHDRRAREVVLSASSDPHYAAVRTRLPAASDTAAGRGLRADQPQIIGERGQTALIAPLRGWRRALGTLVLEGEPADLDDRQYVAAAHELGRQLSVAIENVQLLDDVLQHRRLLEDTFNSLIDLVIVVDQELRVVQMNEAFAERVGQSGRAVIGQRLAGFIGAEMAAWVAAPEVVRAPDSGTAEPPPAERTKVFTDERLDGIFAATVTPLIDPHGAPVGRVVVARDITAQSRLETEREALRERLGQAEKLASLGQFVAGVAHEMNNPLQGVLGHLELLIQTSEAARKIRPTLRRIFQEADRAAKIVRNLMMFTGSQRFSRTPLRMERVLARALASRAVACRRAHIEVTRRVDADLPRIGGDAALLQQALLNILINAEHAIARSGHSGRIDTEIGRSADNESVRLTIRDTGGGIPVDILPRIFDPFFTTKDVGEGTGLGLAITYGIIHDHGGAIEASNDARGGARFTIDLPVLRVDRRPKTSEQVPKTRPV